MLNTKFVDANNIPYTPTKWLSFDDVLLMPQKSNLASRNDKRINLSTRLTSSTSMQIPIISANMDTITGAAMAVSMYKLGGHGILHRFYPSMEAWWNDLKAVADITKLPSFSIGANESDLDIVHEAVNNYGQAVVTVDIAHGHLQKCLDQVQNLSKTFSGKVQIIAGNVVTPAGAFDLINAGAHAIKVGVGPGCFSADTKVLMSNGTYKKISEIIPGEKVINMNGDPVVVNKVFSTGIRKVGKVKHNSWHKDTIVTSDHKYWIGDMSTLKCGGRRCGNTRNKLDQPTKRGESKYKWCPVGEMNPKNQYVLLPRNIKFELKTEFEIDLADNSDFLHCSINDDTITTYTQKEITFNRKIKPSYNLGYIFGSFLGDGTSGIAINPQNNCESAHTTWTFGGNEQHMAEKLKLAINDVLNVEAKIYYKNNTINVTLFNKAFTKVLRRFDKKTSKHLPLDFLINNKEYLDGLYDGLIDSDGSFDVNRNKFCNTSEQLIELMYFLHMMRGESFGAYEKEITAGNLKNCNIENCNQPYNIYNHSLSRKTINYIYGQLTNHSFDNPEEIETWDIEVDCPTHSFIADNTIVHNSLCSTRIVTGHGLPQLTAILNIRRALYAMKSNTTLIADGGIRTSGDIVKALAAGADSVMIGRLLAGTDETPGEVLADGNHRYKVYRGQSSRSFLDDVKKSGVSAEGITIEVPVVGSVIPVFQELVGGIKSGFSYSGATSISELFNRGVFVEMSRAGYMESIPHAAN